jgi:hypothetical protein
MICHRMRSSKPSAKKLKLVVPPSGFHCASVMPELL